MSIAACVHQSAQRLVLSKTTIDLSVRRMVAPTEMCLHTLTAQLLAVVRALDMYII